MAGMTVIKYEIPATATEWDACSTRDGGLLQLKWH